MISFMGFQKEEAEEIQEKILSFAGKEAALAFRETFLSSDFDDTAVCFFEDGFCVRIFDGQRYLFSYPFGLCREKLVEEINEYAAKEEIPLVFFRVPREFLGSLAGAFRHIEFDAEDILSDFYRARIMSEAELIEEPIFEGFGEVSLLPLTESDIKDYAELSRDMENNKYWGYDYREDISDPDDRYFYDTVKSEFERGVSLTFAVKKDGNFIGEAAFYKFDRKGGAEISFRLLPKWQGAGLGRATLEAMLSLAEKVGLVKIKATVDKRNISSLKLLGDYMDTAFDDGARVHFSLSCEECSE